jgi:hypothetical protein
MRPAASLPRALLLAVALALALLPAGHGWAQPARQADPRAAVEPIGTAEVVAEFFGPMPTGVTVSQDGRIFVNFPRWEDAVEATVA